MWIWMALVDLDEAGLMDGVTSSVSEQEVQGDNRRSSTGVQDPTQACVKELNSRTLTEMLERIETTFEVRFGGQVWCGGSSNLLGTMV